MTTLVSDSLDPYYNLACEDLLLDGAGETAPALFLWRGSRSVVIGKHQNPWRECRLAALRACGGVLARRISGGGAVYHDEGNLNYAFFVPRDGFRPENQFAVVIAALARLGVRAERMGKTSLAVEGLKISGNAFCHRRQAVMHHGTLLVSADLACMARALKGTDAAFATHAVASEPARVGNLTRWSPTLTPAELAHALQDAFRASAGAGETVDAAAPEPAAVQSRREALAAWDWCFGRTPAFDVTVRRDFAWGGLSLAVRVAQGCVESARASGDGLPAASAAGLESLLPGAPFVAAEWASRIRRLAMETGDARLEQVAEWAQREEY